MLLFLLEPEIVLSLILSHVFLLQRRYRRPILIFLRKFILRNSLVNKPRIVILRRLGSIKKWLGVIKRWNFREQPWFLLIKMPNVVKQVFIILNYWQAIPVWLTVIAILLLGHLVIMNVIIDFNVTSGEHFD